MLQSLNPLSYDDASPWTYFSARSNLRTTRSFPSAATSSNSPGPFVLPVTAKRVVWIAGPAPIPRASATPRTAASIVS